MSGNADTIPPTPDKLRTTDLPLVDEQDDIEMANSSLLNENKSSVNSYVDQHTELKDLSVAEMYELNQHLLDESKPTDRPLVGGIDPISYLRAEYENGSEAFKAQIDALEKRGFICLRRALGDGDCYYRAMGFAFVQRLMTSPNKQAAATRALAHLESTLPLLDQANYQKDIYEDFYEPLRSLIQKISGPVGLSFPDLLSAFQDPMLSNSIVYFLRLLTSAQMQANAAEYEPFFIDSTMKEFIQTQVEALGIEADHMQINALSAALKTNLEIAYLDGHVSSKVIDFVTLTSSEDAQEEPLHLLYRPGHYDILLTAEEAAVVAADVAGGSVTTTTPFSDAQYAGLRT